MSKKILSGVQATGKLHIGNYFGAMKQFVDLGKEHNAFYMIADLHSLTTVQDREVLRENIFDVALDYLAIGIDPNRSVIFRQSDVPAHTELTWIFNCLTTMPYLMRAHAFKDADAKAKEVNVGLFDYPILMSADILLYSPDIVPVGEDQKQHIEYARDIAEKFNRIYGETFKLPKEYILEDVGTIPGTDGRKMSKSYGNHIPLFSERSDIEKLVMGIVTDSKTPDEKKDTEGDTLFRLHSLVSNDETLSKVREGYTEGGLGYGETKKMLVESMDSFIAPLREKRHMLSKDREHVLSILEEGAEVAQKEAEEIMARVREVVGLTLQ